MQFRGVFFNDYVRDELLTWTHICAECIVRHFMLARKAALDPFDISEYLRELRPEQHMLSFLPCGVAGCIRTMDYVLSFPADAQLTFVGEETEQNKKSFTSSTKLVKHQKRMVAAHATKISQHNYSV